MAQIFRYLEKGGQGCISNFGMGGSSMLFVEKRSQAVRVGVVIVQWCPATRRCGGVLSRYCQLRSVSGKSADAVLTRRNKVMWKLINHKARY